MLPTISYLKISVTFKGLYNLAPYNQSSPISFSSSVLNFHRASSSVSALYFVVLLLFCFVSFLQSLLACIQILLNDILTFFKVIAQIIVLAQIIIL